MGTRLIFRDPMVRLKWGGRRGLDGRGDRRPRPARATAFDPEAVLHPATKSPPWTIHPALRVYLKVAAVKKPIADFIEIKMYN
jgi:hypothetical protein